MQNEFPFPERFDFLEMKLNKILEKVHELSLQIVEFKKPFLSLQEAAVYLNLTKNTVYGWSIIIDSPVIKPAEGYISALMK